MKERPILFNAAMVRAILEGRKTQTRRVVKQDLQRLGDGDFYAFDHKGINYRVNARHTTVAAWAQLLQFCPYGQPGNRLWVRETWQYYDWNDEGEPCIRLHADNATTWPEPGNEAWADKLVDVWEFLSRDENYRIDNRARDRRWRPSIHMPRWASRITLEIAGVRVERLNDISENDCIAEGCPGGHGAIPGYGYSATPAEHFRHIWETTGGDWAANPWVWVIEFKPLGKFLA